MKTIFVLSLIILGQACRAEEIDFLSIIKESSETSRALGIQKLDKDEQATLNALLNRAYQLGIKHQVTANTEMPATTLQPTAPPTKKQPVYITKIDEDNDDILKLDNGAVAEITHGYLGFVGFRKDAVLYKDGKNWRIWIEGKKAFNCDLLKAPTNKPSGAGETISISEVKGDGRILVALDGSLFEVNDLHTIETTLWLGSFDALLIDGSRLVNLDEGSEIIDVTKIR